MIIPPKKVFSPREWDSYIRRVMDEDRFRRHQATFLANLTKWVSIPILVGLAASVLLVEYYGWYYYFRALLTTIVNLTIFATVAAYLIRGWGKSKPPN